MKLKTIISLVLGVLLLMPVGVTGQYPIQKPKELTQPKKKPKKKKTQTKTGKKKSKKTSSQSGAPSSPKPEPVPQLPTPAPQPEPKPDPQPQVVAPVPEEPQATPQPQGLYYNSSTHELVYGAHRYKMVYVDGGTFSMGATPEQSEPYSDEKPVHRVTLSSYYIGQTEVPQWLWVAVMGSNPSNWKGDNLPVEQVSWDDCQEFLWKLNNMTGQHFKLPTEAQWEYAARGGNRSNGYQYSGNDGLGAVGWYESNSNYTHEVGQKIPNELGLYDMSGNVWEWCSDRFGKYGKKDVTDPTGPSSGSDRVFRGGSWYNTPWFCRVASRSSVTPDSRSDDLGFRLGG